jgi:hypothetical protein
MSSFFWRMLRGESPTKKGGEKPQPRGGIAGCPAFQDVRNVGSILCPESLLAMCSQEHRRAATNIFEALLVSALFFSNSTPADFDFA